LRIFHYNPQASSVKSCSFHCKSDIWGWGCSSVAELGRPWALPISIAVAQHSWSLGVKLPAPETKQNNNKTQPPQSNSHM
jgi:hypothetical protein